MIAFRFDPESHAYFDLDSGDVIPHISGMLKEAGWIDTTWMTEEASERGSAVHRLTAAYDLGACEIDECEPAYRPWVQAYADASAILRPEWDTIEQPMVHPILRYGGTPDRVGKLYGAVSVLEIKSCPATGTTSPAWHAIQTALQAILVAGAAHLEPRSIQRYALYIRPNGKWKLEQHRNAFDFTNAREVIAGAR